MHAGELVLQHSELIDFPELFKHGSKFLLLEMTGDLPHEKLNCVTLPMRRRRRL